LTNRTSSVLLVFPQAALGEATKSGLGYDIGKQNDVGRETHKRDPARGTTEGNEGSTMGDRIQINRVAERFSSNTLAHPMCPADRTSEATRAAREKLIAALVEVVAAGGDPRLV
jgi:hypothetical protein